MPTVPEDENAIHDLLAAYCYCVDRGDVDAFVELFTEDCVWDGGPWGRAEGRRALRESRSSRVDSGAVKPRHLSSNELISVSGDTAVARSYVLVMNVAQSPPVPLVIGCYEDQFARLGGRWLFKSRSLRNESVELIARDAVKLSASDRLRLLTFPLRTTHRADSQIPMGRRRDICDENKTMLSWLQ
jgi:ketosteroid isomerase-like protein